MNKIGQALRNVNKKKVRAVFSCFQFFFFDKTFAAFG